MFSDNVSVLVGKGDGTFEAALNFGTHTRPFSLADGDLNGDGKPDLAVANLDTNDVSVLLNTTATAVDVLVAIKPGTGSNPINPRASGVIPVPILSTASFDSTSVDPASVCFWDADDRSQRDCTEAHGTGHVQDVNGDRRLDLLLHFDVAETGIDPDDTTACLTAKTFVGVDVEGCDLITTV